MKKICSVAALLALLALVAILCWRQRLAVPVSGAQAGTEDRAADLATLPAAQPGAQAGPVAAEAAADATEASGAVAGSTVPPPAKRGPSPSPRPPLTPEAAYLATQPPVEATVLEEEENGQVIFQANPADMGPDGFPLLLQQTMQKPGGAAASDLLAMFQSEQSLENKLDILAASSLLEPDGNTQKLLGLALDYDQPQELRISALAYLADQGSFMLQSYLNDPDPAVGLEAQSAYDNLSIPPPTSIVGSQPPPSPLNVARPPEWINQARAN